MKKNIFVSNLIEHALMMKQFMVNFLQEIIPL